MAHDNLTYDDLLRIVELVKASAQFSEFRLKVGDIEVELRRPSAGGAAPSAAAQAASEPAARAVASSATLETGGRAPPRATTARAQADAPPATMVVAQADWPPAATVTAQADWPPHAAVVRAPMVGTFYRAPQPGAPPFVTVGQAVVPDTVVCIIEVMKLMSSIAAGVAGVVTHILVDDGEAVGSGQPLIVLAPAAS